MMLLACLLHSVVVALCLYAAVQVFTGQALSDAAQIGLLTACAVYAVDAAHWCWTTRPRPPDVEAVLRGGPKREG